MTESENNFTHINAVPMRVAPRAMVDAAITGLNLPVEARSHAARVIVLAEKLSGLNGNLESVLHEMEANKEITLPKKGELHAQ